MRRSAFLFVVLLAPDMAGAESHLPVAPQYYLDTVVGMSLAEQYVWHCPELQVDGKAMAAAYNGTLERLAAAGIPIDAPHEHMLLPPSAETDAIIHDMLEQHQAADDPAQAFCNGARVEIAKGSIVGSFMVDAE